MGGAWYDPQAIVSLAVQPIFESKALYDHITTMRIEIGLVPKQDWAQTQAAQRINL